MENTKGSHKWLRPLIFAAYITALISFVFAAVSAPRLLSLLGHRDPNEYKLVVIQSLLGALAVNLPYLIRRFGFTPPEGLSLLFILFLWGSIFLGEALGFYYRFAHWDDLLHLVSSIMLGFVGFSLADLLGRQSGSPAPLFAAIFALCFATSLGAVWEIYEYLCDGALGINMQKFSDGSAIADGLTPLIGREALRDTMEDLIVDFLGAATTAAAGYLIRRRKSTK